MSRRKWSWTDHQAKKSDQVLAVVRELQEWWPLTLRQIYYRLVSKGYIENTRSQYGMLSKLVKWMRIDGILPWETLSDRSRSVSDKRGYEDLQHFIDTEKEYLFSGYNRCLVQGQETYVEVWVEKDALSKIFYDVAYPYCIRTVVCRGYQSVTFISDFYRRAYSALGKRQTPIVLYFGDLDPSGVQMLEATRQTLETELGLSGVDFRRIALNPNQVEQFNLPSDPNAVKLSDPRYQKYVKKFGEIGVELDALHPVQLSEMVEAAIKKMIDMKQFEEQREIEEIEAGRIEEIRNDLLQTLSRNHGV